MYAARYDNAPFAAGWINNKLNRVARAKSSLWEGGFTGGSLWEGAGREAD